MPIGEEYGGATYFMLETHYDNPSKDQDLVDTSGMLSISLIIMLKVMTFYKTNGSCSKIIFQVYEYSTQTFYVSMIRV